MIITQARIGSTRLPGKVLRKIGNETILSVHLSRLKLVKLAHKIIIATTFEQKTDEILRIAEEAKVLVYRGSTLDVLDRYYKAAIHYGSPQLIIRVTSDCPLIDPNLIDLCITEMQVKKLNYFHTGGNYPDGFDVEVFTFELLKQAHQYAMLSYQREHVTPYIREIAMLKGTYGILPLVPNSHVRVTVDEESDLQAIDLLVKELGINKSWNEYVDYIVNHPDRFLNQSITRNEGFIRNL